MGQGGAAAVYILDAAQRKEIIAELAQRFAQVEGVERVLVGNEVQAVGQAVPEEHPWAPDLWLAAKRDYVFGESASGDLIVERPTVGGTHGYLPDDPDMWAMCVIWGPGITPGTRLGKVRLVDLAPTIAALLGLDFGHADGHPLVTVP